MCLKSWKSYFSGTPCTKTAPWKISNLFKMWCHDHILLEIINFGGPHFFQDSMLFRHTVPSDTTKTLNFQTKSSDLSVNCPICLLKANCKKKPYLCFWKQSFETNTTWLLNTLKMFWFHSGVLISFNS